MRAGGGLHCETALTPARAAALATSASVACEGGRLGGLRGRSCTRRPDVTVWSRWKVTTSRGARRLLCRPRVCQTAGVCVQSACLHLTPRCVLSRLADVSVFYYCIWIGCAPSVVAQSLLCRSRGGAHWAAALLRRVRRARRRGRGRVQRTACVRRRHCGVWCEPREVRGRPRCAR